MASLKNVALALFAAVPGVLGVSLPVDYDPTPVQVKRQALAPAGPDCTNTPQTRGSWCPNFDINTDYDLVAPDTGKTVTHDLRVSKKQCAPDGSNPKMCTLINGQYPGPTIRAKWGDKVRIIVHNDVADNGTGIHWHGVRQLRSTPQDGANGVTECPIAPGTTKTYEYRATQHGTSWYHSHHSVQYGEGVVGPIVFDGPNTENYDVDLGALPLTDWYYGSSWDLNWNFLHAPGALRSNNILVNGTMKSATGTGKYNVITVEKNKSYKLRLINTAVDHTFTFSMDGHPFDIVATDFVPTVPRKNLRQVTLNIGQRYDIIFNATQTAGNYWMRVRPGCANGGVSLIYDSEAVRNGSIVPGGVLHYSTAPVVDGANSTGTALNEHCDDEPSTPFWPRTVPSAPFVSSLSKLNLTFGPLTRQNENLVTWFINSSSMDVDWAKPTLQYVLDKQTNNFPREFNLYELNGTDTTWTYWVIQEAGAPFLPHPIHLHGHDFWVLGSGSGTFDGTTNGLSFNNPRRRDTALLPEGGWLVLAFVMDNPGAWLMHCHIGWHVSGGLSLQFLERKNEIVSSVGTNQFDEFKNGCAAWNNFKPVWPDFDSGL